MDPTETGAEYAPVREQEDPTQMEKDTAAPRKEENNFLEDKQIVSLSSEVVDPAHEEENPLELVAPTQNYDYCSKDGDFIERGERPQRGCRTDLKKAVADRVDGKSDKDMLYLHGTSFIRCKRGIDSVASAIQTEKKRSLIKEKYVKVVLKEWQYECEKKLLDQDDRKILFVVDPEGNNGKTYTLNTEL